MTDLTRTIYLSAIDSRNYADDDQSPDESSYSNNAYSESFNMKDSIIENQRRNNTVPTLNVRNETLTNMRSETNTAPHATTNNTNAGNKNVEDSHARNLSSSLLNSIYVGGTADNHKMESSSPEASTTFTNSSRTPLHDIPYTHSELPFGSTREYHIHSPEESYYEDAWDGETGNTHTLPSIAFVNHVCSYIKWYIAAFIIMFIIQLLNAIFTPDAGGKIVSIISAIFAIVCIGYLEKIRQTWLR